MHGVGLDVTATAQELHFDDNEVMNVCKVLSNGVLGMSRIAPSDDEVASCPQSDVTGHMAS